MSTTRTKAALRPETRLSSSPSVSSDPKPTYCHSRTTLTRSNPPPWSARATPVNPGEPALDSQTTFVFPTHCPALNLACLRTGMVRIYDVDGPSARGRIGRLTYPVGKEATRLRQFPGWTPWRPTWKCVGKTSGVGLSRSKFEEGAGRGSCAVPGVTEGRRQAGG